MFEPLIQLEIYKENDTFHGKINSITGLKEYENKVFIDLLNDIFIDLEEENIGDESAPIE